MHIHIPNMNATTYNRLFVILTSIFMVCLGCYQARVANTHEPRQHDYNDATEITYWYIVLKCVFNILCGIYLFVCAWMPKFSTPEINLLLFIVYIPLQIWAGVLYFLQYKIIYIFKIVLMIELIFTMIDFIFVVIIGYCFTSRHPSPQKIQIAQEPIEINTYIV